ncbi:hypothetical protein BHM03_00029226, partial [Ensete ventricosum]
YRRKYMKGRVKVKVKLKHKMEQKQVKRENKLEQAPLGLGFMCCWFRSQVSSSGS